MLLLRLAGLTRLTDIEGYESIERGPHTVLIRPAWKDPLLEDLLEDFRNVPSSERRLYAHGRATHFSYRPRGAPERVFVRAAVRGGLVGTLLGGLNFGIRRPVRELVAASAARRAGVSVPEPLAVRATRVAGLFWRFTVVAREVQGASDLLALAEGLSPARKRDLIHRVADEMRRLHEAGVYHADLTLKNILLSGSDVYIIDLDKATLSGRRSDALDVMNLSRLNRSVEKLLGGRGSVTRVDKIRFLRRYLRGRDRLKDIARRCASGLGFHRLWWSVTGQA
jgi:tRNA A-37 threonylcarbamoyl transferase component Bud32